MKSYRSPKLSSAVCIALVIVSALSALYSVHVLCQFAELYYMQGKTESYIKEVAVGFENSKT